MTPQKNKKGDERKCKTCGGIFLPVRYHNGRQTVLSRSRFCPECYKKRKTTFARPNYDPEKFRKHRYKTCAYCGEVFSVIGLTDAGRKKTCSRDCFAGLARKLAVNREAWKAAAKGRHKGWDKHFEKTMKTEGWELGPTNKSSVAFCIKSPEGKTYTGLNITDFVRENEHLFPASKVVWVPTNKKSKVPLRGYRPSHAKGCLRCKASAGLQAVVRGVNGSWFGWTSQTLP